MATRRDPTKNIYPTGQTYTSGAEDFVGANISTLNEGLVPYPGRGAQPLIPSPYSNSSPSQPGGGNSGVGSGGGASGGSYGGGGSNVTAPKKPTLYSGEELANLFGLVFGQDAIYDILQQATNAKFDEYDSQTRKIRDQQLTDYSSQYNQYLQNTRNQRQSALKNGLSKGTSVAQEVLSQLGAQQQGAQTQQLYQQQLGDIAYQRGSQLAADEYNAMMTQNDLATTLGNLSIGQYGNEVQHDAAYMSLLGQQAQAAAQNAMANAQRYSADQSRASYNDQAANAQIQNSAVYTNLTASGMPATYASLVATGQMDYQTAMTLWDQDKRKLTGGGTSRPNPGLPNMGGGTLQPNVMKGTPGPYKP